MLTQEQHLCHCQILRGDLYNDRDRRIIKMLKP